ncbi:hypothetical protein DXG03_006643 [Asterophora parasitica]|uniref:DUF4211 domain-containing protein n=1 Tax=Asterophora parasitica TaxID=117018 RepID=A0A9P7KEU2_9AGAR|nr:hypothetical protein DXG03_006643 [Asterophora parasitica]
MLPKGKSSKSLRQTTFFEASKSSSRALSSKLPPSPRAKRKRNAIVPTPADNDDEGGLGSIKFEPEKSRLTSDDDDPPALKKRRSRPVVDSDDSQSRVQRKTRLKHKGKSQESDGEEDDAQRPRRRKLVKKRVIVLASSDDDEDLAEEVEKDRAKPSSDLDSLFDEDSDANNSSDFIVEDDNEAPALPMEFSMESHEDLDHQFKKIFQFFVHIAVRPAKERHHYMKEQLRKEEYFSVPLQMVRRKISGLRDSLVTSSLWRPAFKTPLDTYPEFDLIPLSFAVPACDACHLGGRMSTLTGRLSGAPYDQWGFEVKHKIKPKKLEDDSSGSEDSDGSEEEPAVVEFDLGRFCARRTRVYHEFTHWEWALFKCIREEVDELHESHQSGGFFRMAYAGGKKPPKDLDDADGICDWLDQRKVIDMQWQKLKDMMESARHLELDRKKGGDVD